MASTEIILYNGESHFIDCECWAADCCSCVLASLFAGSAPTPLLPQAASGNGQLSLLGLFGGCGIGKKEEKSPHGGGKPYRLTPTSAIEAKVPPRLVVLFLAMVARKGKC